MIAKSLTPFALVLAAPAWAGDKGPQFLPSGGPYPFSEAVQVDNVIYLSGQLGIDDSGKALVKGGIIPETRRVMEGIGKTLAKYGLDHDALFKCTVMLADLKDFGAFNTAYKSFFKPGRYPSRSAFQTAGLVFDARVEVECWAWNPQGGDVAQDEVEEPAE